MPSDDSSGSRPASPIVLRIKLRYDDVEVMVQRFAVNVGKSGLFLPTKTLQPVGAEIKFELRLADEAAVLVGLGRVKAVTAPDPLRPHATFGMAIELMRVTPQSRALILRMLERRRELGLPELGLPMAADIDAGRRAEAAHGVTEQTPVVQPVAPPRVAPIAEPRPTLSSTPGPIEAPAAEPLMTAPRRSSGSSTVAPLGPEPQRRKRMAVSEVIDSASGATAGVSSAVAGLDDEVDVAGAIVRARALTGGAHGLDAELDALAEQAAAPIEISVEAASAELARQLGGSAVRRDRSARWRTPPATTAMPAPAAESAPHRGVALAAPHEPEAATSHSELGPAARADSVQPLDDFDLEEVEHTELGIVPARASAIDLAMLEARRAADAEARRDVLTRADDPAHDVNLEEIDDFEILAEADAGDEHLLGATATQDVSVSRRRIGEPDFAARLDLGDDSDRHLAISAAERARRRDRVGHVEDLHADSAGHALAAFDTDDSFGETSELPRAESEATVVPIFEPESSNSFTLAGVLQDSLDLDAPSSSMQPMAAPEPEISRTRPAAQRARPAKEAPSLYDSPVEDHELEHALEALDVDLDDLSIPHADTHLQRGLGPSTLRPSRASQGPVIRPASATRSPSSGRVVASRPPSDDDVAIEFEEED